MKLNKKDQQRMIINELDSILKRWKESDKDFLTSEKLQYQLFGMRSVIHYVFGLNSEVYKRADFIIQFIIEDK